MMLSFDHELLVELFRNNGRLAVELLRTCAGISVDHARVELRSIDLTQIAPTEYRADAVVILHDEAGKPVIGIIVEVQRSDDADKLLTWPVYVTALRRRFACPALLLVLAPGPAVAAWARQPIELGHPGFRLAPLVVELEDVPSVRDPVVASQLPELAVLSAMAHPELEIAEVAIEAVVALAEDKRQLYLDVILTSLPPAIRQLLEGRMQRYEYRSDFARTYYGQGREEGREEGRDEGRKEGRQQGHQDGLRAAVIELAHTKLEVLSERDLAAIDAIADPLVLTGLVASLGRARDAVEARAALDLVLAR